MLDMTRKSNWITLGAAAGIIVAPLVFVAPAHAQLTNFAEFGRSSGTPTNAFTFTNTGSVSDPTDGTSSSFQTATMSEAFNFQYDTANGYGADGDAQFTPIAALLTVTATAAGPATSSGSTLTQSLSSFTFSFTAVTPYGGYTNLLSGSFSTAAGATMYLSGTAGGGSPTISVSSSSISGVSGFSSDFLDFKTDTFTSEQFSISLSAAQNTTQIGSAPTQNSHNDYLNSFEANGTGTFSSNPVPPSFSPTPATPGDISLIAGLAIGALQFGRVKVRARRKRAASAG